MLKSSLRCKLFIRDLIIPVKRKGRKQHWAEEVELQNRPVTASANVAGKCWSKDRSSELCWAGLQWLGLFRPLLCSVVGCRLCLEGHDLRRDLQPKPTPQELPTGD